MDEQGYHDEIIDKRHDLVWSQDDEEEHGAGWYVVKYPEQISSQHFKTRTEALRAFSANKCKWSD